MVSVSSQGVGQAWRCPVCPAEIRGPEEAARHEMEEDMDGRPGHVPVLLAVVTDDKDEDDGGE